MKKVNWLSAIGHILFGAVMSGAPVILAGGGTKAAIAAAGGALLAVGKAFLADPTTDANKNGIPDSLETKGPLGI